MQWLHSDPKYLSDLKIPSMMWTIDVEIMAGAFFQSRNHLMNTVLQNETEPYASGY